MIKNIIYKKQLLAKIIKKNYIKKKGINFFTPNTLSQQVAYMNHKTGHKIKPHIHLKSIRKIKDTMEVLIILEGILKINFFNKLRKCIKTFIASKGDIVILIQGAHGFEIKKNCKFIEVKQGPYKPTKDKLKF